MLSWANQFNICCLLDNNDYKSIHHSYDMLLGVGSKKIFTTTSNQNQLNDLKVFLADNNDWLFGHVSYDFKNHIYPLNSNNIDNVSLPDVFLFQPEIIIRLVNGLLTIESLTTLPQKIFELILATQITATKYFGEAPIQVEPRIKKQEYINIINNLKNHLQQGDCYEINFCQEFFADEIEINPLNIYTKLNDKSPTPFGAFYKINNKYLLCYFLH